MPECADRPGAFGFFGAGASTAPASRSRGCLQRTWLMAVVFSGRESFRTRVADFPTLNSEFSGDG